jgi:hypothetical protein
VPAVEAALGAALFRPALPTLAALVGTAEAVGGAEALVAELVPGVALRVHWQPLGPPAPADASDLAALEEAWRRQAGRFHTHLRFRLVAEPEAAWRRRVDVALAAAARAATQLGARRAVAAWPQASGEDRAADEKGTTTTKEEAEDAEEEAYPTAPRPTRSDAAGRVPAAPARVAGGGAARGALRAVGMRMAAVATGTAAGARGGQAAVVAAAAAAAATAGPRDTPSAASVRGGRGRASSAEGAVRLRAPLLTAAGARASELLRGILAEEAEEAEEAGEAGEAGEVGARSRAARRRRRRADEDEEEQGEGASGSDASGGDEDEEDVVVRVPRQLARSSAKRARRA